MYEKIFKVVLGFDYFRVEKSQVFYKGDAKSGFIEIVLYDKSNRVDLSQFYNIIVVIKKPDSNTVSLDKISGDTRLSFTNQNMGELKYELGVQETSEIGDYKVHICLCGNDGERVTTSIFEYSVIEPLDTDGLSVISTSVNSFNYRIGQVEALSSNNSIDIGLLESEDVLNKARMSTIESDITVAEEGITALESSVVDIDLDIVGIGSNIVDINAIISTESDKVIALELDNADNKSKILALETDNTDNKSKISTLETTSTSEASKVLTLETELALIKGRLDLIESKDIETDLTLTDLTDRIIALEPI